MRGVESTTFHFYEGERHVSDESYGPEVERLDVGDYIYADGKRYRLLSTEQVARHVIRCQVQHAPADD